MVEPVPANAAEDEPERDDESRASRRSAGSHRNRASKGQKKKRSFWKELPILIVVALVLTFLIQTFLARVYMIPSGSMETTLHGCPGCTDDRVLVDKITYAFSDPEPGDVVVFKGPDPWTENDIAPQESGNGVAKFFQTIGSVVGLAPPDERDFVKRVIATGGQTVECCDSNRVKVDGKPLNEPYIHWQNGEPEPQEEFPRVRVPDGSVWVMGDNRMNSCDSRCQGGGGERGAVPVDNIIGKARLIVLPPSRWSGISAQNPQTSPQAAALGAPAWQDALPAGVGVVAAWPAVWAGRRIRKAVGKRER